MGRRWSVWFLLAALLRRVVMKPIMDPRIRELLGMPTWVQHVAPLLRLMELFYFVKVHQIVVVALDNASGSANMVVMAPTMALLAYIKLVADLWIMGKHAISCIQQLLGLA